MILSYGKDIFYESGLLQVTNNNTNTEYRNNITFLDINRKKDTKDALYIIPHNKIVNVSKLENQLTYLIWKHHY